MRQPLYTAAVRRNAADALFYKAYLASEQGKEKEAIQLYEEAIELNPTMTIALLNLGIIFLNKFRYEDAERCLREVIHLEPEYATAHFTLGNCLDQIDRKEEAIEHYRKAIAATGGTYGDAHFNLATTFVEVGEFQLALKHYRLHLKYETDLAARVVAEDRIRMLLDKAGLKVVVGFKGNARAS